jgi:hypothetical protein
MSSGMNLLFYLYKKDFVPFSQLTSMFGDCKRELDELENWKLIFHLQDSEKTYTTTDYGESEVERWILKTNAKRYGKKQGS